MSRRYESDTQTDINLSERKKYVVFIAGKGQGLIEYAIILSFVALVVIVVMWMLGPEVGNTYSTINSSLP